MPEFYDQKVEETMNRQKLSTREKLFFFGAVPGVIIAAVAAVFLFLVPGEGSPIVEYNPNAVTTMAPSGPDLPLTTTETPVQVDHNGNWLVDSGNGAVMTAVVKDGTIEITLKNEGAEMLYWVGTFDATAPVGTVVKSDSVEVQDVVLSSAAEKDFTINPNGTIGFQLQAMGRTKELELHRV